MKARDILVGASNIVVALLCIAQLPVGGLRETTTQPFAANAQEVGWQQGSRMRLSSDGTMSGVTLQRTRVYDVQGLAEPKAILWKTIKLATFRPSDMYTYTGGLGSISFFYERPTSNSPFMPVVAGKELYFSAFMGDGYWFVVDLQTGETKKKFTLKRSGFSQPVVAGDLLYLGTSEGAFTAFDRSNWQARWSIGRKNYRFSNAAPAVVDGVVYFGGAEAIGSNANMHAVDALTGTSKWMFPVKGHPTPAAVAKDAVYFGDGDRNFFAVNTKTGQEIWSFKALEYVRTLTIMDGRVFFADIRGNLYALDLDTGKELWRVTKKNKVVTPLAAYHGLIYYGGNDYSLCAVDAATGELKWVYQAFKPIFGPVVANGVVYSANLDKLLFAIDAVTGQEKWKYKAQRPLYAAPVVGNGIIYFLDEEGFISALG
jgi:eukaryotic-like serine/threonine-protein kinase